MPKYSANVILVAFSPPLSCVSGKPIVIFAKTRSGQEVTYSRAFQSSSFQNQRQKEKIGGGWGGGE